MGTAGKDDRKVVYRLKARRVLSVKAGNGPPSTGGQEQDTAAWNSIQLLLWGYPSYFAGRRWACVYVCVWICSCVCERSTKYGI